MENNIYFNEIVKGAFVKESIEILHNAYLSKKLVLFVGAGADFDSGIPLWKEAIRQFCEHLTINPDGADNLKIPQFYFNSRGKKEYVELCRQIFRYREELPINALHKKIVGLNVNTTITTNYTDFLEREMKNRGHIYKTVAQDRDLPYTNNEKLIIKMHGDFGHDNFVLKEDDYLNYSKNFRLIETYVKAVIAKNVVLFIGYSFNDPDIKQIFSWVKDVLGNDFQQAYMLESYADYDENTFEYYKNLGVNVIYTKLFGQKSREIQLNLMDMIKSGIQENLSGADSAGAYLKPLLELDYILAKYLNKGLQKCGLTVEKGILHVSPGRSSGKSSPSELLAQLSDRIQKEPESTDDMYSTIADAIRKSGTIYITVPDTKKEPEHLLEILHPKNESVKLIQSFDYTQLRAEASQNDFFKRDNEHIYLRQAYIYYTLEEYEKAYAELCNAAETAFRKHHHYIYYIAQYNKHNIKRAIGWGFSNVSSKIQEIIDEDLNSVSLRDIITDTPDLASTDNQVLKDIDSFQYHYSMFQDAYRAAEKVKEQQNTQYFIYDGVPDYQTLQWMVQDYYHYIAYNCLMVDNYRELRELFTLYIKSILGSATAPDRSNTDGGLHTQNIHAFVSNIGCFELFLMIKYMSEKEIQDIFSQCNVKYLPLQDSCQDYMRTALNNLRKEKSLKCDRELWGCLAIISYTVQKPGLAEDAVDCIAQKFNYFVYNTHKAIIYRLLSNCYENKCFKEKQEGLFDPNAYALGRFLNQAIQQAAKTEQRALTAYNSIVPLVSSCYHALYGNTYDKNIEGLLYPRTCLILAKIYPHCGEVNKNRIRAYFLEQMKSASWPFYDKYGEAVLNEVIEPDQNFEQEIYNHINEIREQSRGCFPNDYENVLVTLFDLYSNHKIINTAKLKNILRESDNTMMQFLSDMENFDYSLFDINWLLSFSDGLLADIANNETVKKAISRIFADQMEKYQIDTPLLKKFFKYFVR